VATETLYPVSALRHQPYCYFGRTFVFDVSPSEARTGLIENILGVTHFTQIGLQLRKIASKVPVTDYPEEEMKYQSGQLKIGFHELTKQQECESK